MTGKSLGHRLDVHLLLPRYVPESQVLFPQYYQPSQPDLLLPEVPHPTCSNWQKWLTGFEGGIFLISPTPKVKKEKSPLQTRTNKSPPPTEHGVLRWGNLECQRTNFQGLSQHKVQDSVAMRRMLMSVQAACKCSLIDLCLSRAADWPPAQNLAVSRLQYLQLRGPPWVSSIELLMGHSC